MKMKYHITHEKNGIYHGLLVEACSQEVAEAYFREQEPENRFIDIHEARVEDMKPGKPVMVVPNGYGLGLSYKEFKAEVLAKGGIWASDDVYFSQYRDGYSASYQPNYPEHSKEDCAFAYNWLKNEWRFEDPKSYDAKYRSVGMQSSSVVIEVGAVVFADDDYLEGVVVVDGEPHPFDYSTKTGEIEVHSYSAPGWLTGSSYEKPLPEIVTNNMEEIVDAIQSAVDEFLKKVDKNLDAVIANATAACRANNLPLTSKEHEYGLD